MGFSWAGEIRTFAEPHVGKAAVWRIVSRTSSLPCLRRGAVFQQSVIPSAWSARRACATRSFSPRSPDSTMVAAAYWQRHLPRGTDVAACKRSVQMDLGSRRGPRNAGRPTRAADDLALSARQVARSRHRFRRCLSDHRRVWLSTEHRQDAMDDPGQRQRSNRLSSIDARTSVATNMTCWRSPLRAAWPSPRAGTSASFRDPCSDGVPTSHS